MCVCLSTLSYERKQYKRVDFVDLLVWFSKTKISFKAINMLSLEDSEV